MKKAKEKLKDKEKLEMARILKDLLDQRNESKRMVQNPNLIWKVRGFLGTVEYWCIAFSFWISILLWIVTGDYWKGITFYFVSQIYTVAGNLRGMGLHVENLIEWLMRKRI